MECSLAAMRVWTPSDGIEQKERSTRARCREQRRKVRTVFERDVEKSTEGRLDERVVVLDG